MMLSFRVLVDVSECGVDGVDAVWLYLAEQRGTEVSWVATRVEAVLAARGASVRPLELWLEGALLPNDEPLDVLRPGDQIRAKPVAMPISTKSELEAQKQQALALLERMTQVTTGSDVQDAIEDKLETMCDTPGRDVPDLSENVTEYLNEQQGGCATKRRRVRRRRRQPIRSDENIDSNKISNSNSTKNNLHVNQDSSHTVCEENGSHHSFMISPANSPNANVALDKIIVHNPSPCITKPRCIQSLTCK